MKNVFQKNLTAALSALLITSLSIGVLSCSKNDEPTPAATPLVPSLIAEYTFNGTLNDVTGANAFSGAAATLNSDNSTVTIAASAIGATATIPGLPIGNSPRTVILRFKTSSNAGFPSVFVYGNTSGSRTAFGLYLGANGNYIFQASGDDFVLGGTVNSNQWRTAVLVFDGTNVRVYNSDTLLDSKAYTLATTQSVFKFGNNTTSIDVDYLKIYNYALSQTELTALFY